MGVVDTLRGPVDAGDLGPVLPHEHLPLHYFPLEHETFLPGCRSLVRGWCEGLLDELLETPFRTLVDVTPMGLGRDIALRREILGDRNLNVVMSTGFYLDNHQPEWAKEKSAEELADMMVREIEEGIDGTDVRAGIIKLAPNASSGQSRKVCRAAVMASSRTGARITTHSCRKNRETFDLLTSLGGDPESIYVGHADFVEPEENEYVCKNRGHVLFTVWDIDYMIPDKLMYKRFAELVDKGYVENVLMSVDFAIMLLDPKKPTHLSWTMYGVEGRTHAYLARKVIPTLQKEYGLGDQDIRTITEDNPRRMLDYRS